jgi:hypothetical protein
VSFALLGRSVVRFQILWVPAHVPDLAVREIVEIIGLDDRINVCTRDFLPLGAQGSGFHGNRFNIEVDGVFPEMVPDRLTIELHGERFPILFLMRGRPRVCFLCNCTGHSQNECPDSICKYCNQKGHRINVCEGKIRNDAETEASFRDWKERNEKNGKQSFPVARDVPHFGSGRGPC